MSVNNLPASTSAVHARKAELEHKLKKAVEALKKVRRMHGHHSDLEWEEVDHVLAELETVEEG